MKKDKSDLGAFGGFIIGIGVIIMVIVASVYTITEIWEIQYGLVLGVIIILIGTISIFYDLEIKNST